jgi:hypothetical protein
LKFSSLKIYSKGETSIIELDKELYIGTGNSNFLTINSLGIETKGIKSHDGSANSGYRIY